MKNSEKTMWMKRICMMLLDISIVILASVGALVVRFDFSLSAVPDYYLEIIWETLPLTIPVAIAVFSA